MVVHVPHISKGKEAEDISEVERFYILCPGPLVNHN